MFSALTKCLTFSLLFASIILIMREGLDKMMNIYDLHTDIDS